MQHRRHGDFIITDDPARVDLDAVHLFLSHEAHWALNRPRTVIARAIEHSLCLTACTDDGALAGFARIVTDYAVNAYLDDVFVLPPYRGQGLAQALVAACIAHPKLSSVTGWTLRTRDAHGLYAKFGFNIDAKPENAMRRLVSPVDATEPHA